MGEMKGGQKDMVFTLLRGMVETQVPSSQSLLGCRVPRLSSQAFPFRVNFGPNMSAAVTGW